mmetsp:Transcript_31644/g.74750  ORF Transcript_31644/g.74750 Transcript_31644/m.74750 type:complete len:210 (-) Transcript_31644:363-992(-)
MPHQGAAPRRTLRIARGRRRAYPRGHPTPLRHRRLRQALLLGLPCAAPAGARLSVRAAAGRRDARAPHDRRLEPPRPDDLMQEVAVARGAARARAPGAQHARRRATSLRCGHGARADARWAHFRLRPPAQRAQGTPQAVAAADGVAQPTQPPSGAAVAHPWGAALLAPRVAADPRFLCARGPHPEPRPRRAALQRQAHAQGAPHDGRHP